LGKRGPKTKVRYLSKKQTTKERGGGGKKKKDGQDPVHRKRKRGSRLGKKNNTKWGAGMRVCSFDCLRNTVGGINGKGSSIGGRLG